MQERTEGNWRDPNVCMDDQRKFLQWFQDTLDEFLLLKDLVRTLQSRQDRADQTLETLQKELHLLGPKYDTVLKILNEQNVELEASKTLRLKLSPVVDSIDSYLTDLKSWRVWWQRIGGISFVWIVVTLFRPDLSPVVLAKMLEVLMKANGAP
jgi:hypothetical protein